MIDPAKAVEIVICCWVVANGTKEPFPLSLLSAALKEAISTGAFPPAFKDIFFSRTPVGDRWLDLPSAIDHAQTAGLVAFPNPLYTAAQLTLSNDLALLILDEHGISEEDARHWGTALKTAVSNISDV